MFIYPELICFLKKDAQNISRRTLSIHNMLYIIHVYTEISVWSWTFGIKSWKSPGNPSVNMCKNPDSGRNHDNRAPCCGCMCFREEWQWLQALSSLEEAMEMDQEDQSAPHRLLQDLRGAIKDLMAHINVPGNQVRVHLKHAGSSARERTILRGHEKTFFSTKYKIIVFFVLTNIMEPDETPENNIQPSSRGKAVNIIPVAIHPVP